MLTAETVAEKPALVAPAWTVTDAGTLTAALLLERLTLSPPVGAAELNVTVQASVPEPVIDAFTQVNPLSAGIVLIPVPLRPTKDMPPVEELLETANCPVSEPETVGSN